jgi:hypothetical protein
VAARAAAAVAEQEGLGEETNGRRLEARGWTWIGCPSRDRVLSRLGCDLRRIFSGVQS